MLSELHIQNTGPFQSLEFKPASRLNLITGDNSLGKTFLLDVIWWALTDSWVDEKAYPYRAVNGHLTGDAKISFNLHQGDPENQAFEWGYNLRTQGWQADKLNEPPMGIVVFSRVDGSFAINDSYRLGPERHQPEPVFLNASEVFRGKKYTQEEVRRWNLEADDICNGLLRDWIDWESRNKPIFDSFLACLNQLSESSQQLIPGKPTRLRSGVSTEIPTLNLPYSNVPITLVSAGMRRILGLAYMLLS
jgi:hypothetical protein